MKNPEVFNLLVLILVTAAGCGSDSPKPTFEPTPNPVSLSIWTPNKDMLDLLNEFSTEPFVNRYGLCPPKDYKFIADREKRISLGNTAYTGAWVGQLRSDLSRPQVQITIFDFEKPDKRSLEQILTKMIELIKEGKVNFSQGPIERGQINGLEFARCEWNGKFRDEPMRGILYIAVDGPTILMLSTQDLEQYSIDALKVAEASIRTFKKYK